MTRALASYLMSSVSYHTAVTRRPHTASSLLMFYLPRRSCTTMLYDDYRLPLPYYLRQGGFVFARVCLFVCLCVSKITQKVMVGFFLNFLGMSGMAKTISDSILGVIRKNPGFWITLKFSLTLL